MSEYPNWNKPDGNAVIDSVELPIELNYGILSINDANESTVGVVQILDTYPSTVSHTDATTSAYVQAAINDAVTSGNSFQGTYDASTNLFPALNSLGQPIDKGDYWIISVGGTPGGTEVFPGYEIISLIDVPGQTSGNWYINTAGKTFNAAQFEIVSNEVSIKTAGITLELMEPNGTDGKLLTAGSTTNPPKYRTLLGTTDQITSTVNNNDITLSLEQGIAFTSSPEFSGLSLSGLNESQLIATDADKNLFSLYTTTYPDLSEVSYVKGVNSAIQTQLDGKAPNPTSFDFYIAQIHGDVYGGGGEDCFVEITPQAVTFPKIQTIAANTLLGNNTGSTANVTNLTVAQVQAMLSSAVTTDATTSIVLDDSVSTVNLTNTGARAVSIPAIIPKKEWVVKDAAFTALTGNITITPTAPILIEGQSSFVMAVSSMSITIYTDGTNLFIK